MRIWLKKYIFIFYSIAVSTQSYGAEQPMIGPHSVNWLGSSSYMYEATDSDKLKTYYLKTDAILRDGIPAEKEVKIKELSHLPYTRTNSPIFDGLYALALQEMVESSVSEITDHSFKPAKCDCFETGEKWKYVWTRDIAYATDLGLASIDPIRSKNSLEFKISAFRNNLGEGEQIVQDTGTGGSWPVSTDRIIWALGAYETLLHLPYKSKEFQNFIQRAYQALKNSVDIDRIAAYDLTDGLYTGEQSFLDWREQSYPNWTRNKVIHIGMSKSLSTNVAQYIALQRLSEFSLYFDDFENYQLYNKWALNLKKAILKNFWDGSSLRSLKTTYLDQRAIKYYDLLGISLAVLEDITDSEQAKKALVNYPQTIVGPPVIWPQIPDVPIYHNRAIWPFVTAYGLKAAKKVNEASLMTKMVKSLMLGPAQNLSNMENFEFLTLRNWLNDGVLSGPVVNSRRQLWSTAGYLSMVQDVIFGKEVQLNSIRFKPAITYKLRREIFSNSSRLSLFNFGFQNRLIEVEINLPKTHKNILNDVDGLYEIEAIYLNGKEITSDYWIKVNELNPSQKNFIQINLEMPINFEKIIEPIKTPENLFKLTKEEYQLYFRPKVPNLYPIGISDNHPLLTFYSQTNEDITYLIFKNAKLLTTTKNTHYLDTEHPMTETGCYTIVARYDHSQNESFPSEPICYWPKGAIEHYSVDHQQLRAQGANYSQTLGRSYLKNWGNPDQKIYLKKFKPNRDGLFAIQVDYNNIERINTGVTCAVKKIRIVDETSGKIIHESVLMFPHHDHDRYWTDSNFVQAKLDSTKTYTIIIEDFQNMSYFKHFDNYKHRGGEQGFYNKLNFAAIKILYIGS